MEDYARKWMKRVQVNRKISRGKYWFPVGVEKTVRYLILKHRVDLNKIRNDNATLILISQMGQFIGFYIIIMSELLPCQQIKPKSNTVLVCKMHEMQWDDKRRSKNSTVTTLSKEEKVENEECALFFFVVTLLKTTIGFSMDLIKELCKNPNKKCFCKVHYQTSFELLTPISRLSKRFFRLTCTTVVITTEGLWSSWTRGSLQRILLHHYYLFAHRVIISLSSFVYSGFAIRFQFVVVFF